MEKEKRKGIERENKGMEKEKKSTGNVGFQIRLRARVTGIGLPQQPFTLQRLEGNRVKE